jgi:hypothetical protein
MFPFFKKIEPRELPENRVKRIIILTIIAVLTNISKNRVLVDPDGILIRKSMNKAREAMKNAKKICQ